MKVTAEMIESDDWSGPYPVHPMRGISPPRFTTEEDAKLFMECLMSSRKYPKEKWIHPFKVLPNGDATINPDYANALFELSYSYGPTPRIVDA